MGTTTVQDVKHILATINSNLVLLGLKSLDEMQLVGRLAQLDDGVMSALEVMASAMAFFKASCLLVIAPPLLCDSC